MVSTEIWKIHCLYLRIHDIKDIVKITEYTFKLTTAELHQSLLQALDHNIYLFHTTCHQPLVIQTAYYTLSITLCALKGALDKYNIIPKLFLTKVVTFLSFDLLAWVMIACWGLHSRLTYCWKNMNSSNIFYFSKSTLINTLYISLRDTLGVMFRTYPSVPNPACSWWEFCA